MYLNLSALLHALHIRSSKFLFHAIYLSSTGLFHLKRFFSYSTCISPITRSLRSCLLYYAPVSSNPARLSTDFRSLWQMVGVPSPALSRLSRVPGPLVATTHFKHGIPREKQQLASASFSTVQSADPSSSVLSLKWTSVRFIGDGDRHIKVAHMTHKPRPELWGSAVYRTSIQGTCKLRLGKPRSFFLKCARDHFLSGSVVFYLDKYQAHTKSPSPDIRMTQGSTTRDWG